MTGRSKALVVALVVFAVAVGVFIGSGPLRAGIGAGTSQADLLDEALADAESAQEAAQAGEDFADATGPLAVAGWLEGRAVALVSAAAVDPADADLASSRLTDAGATVAASVALTEDWSSEARAPFRDALAEQITTALPDPPTGATTDQILATALTQALAAGDDFDGEAQERADTLWTLLTEANLVAGERTADASAFVLVAGDGDASALGGAFAAGSDGTVVAFTGVDGGAAGGAASVTRAATFYGAWAVVGALIDVVSGGTAGEYDASDADELIGGLGQ